MLIGRQRLTLGGSPEPCWVSVALSGLLWEPHPAGWLRGHQNSRGLSRVPVLAARTLTWDPGWSLPDWEPTSEQGASPWHQVAPGARTQTLYPGCEQGSRERNGNLRFRSEETGCHWRTIEQRRVGGHSRACRMERQRPGVLGPLAPPAPGAAVPAHPAGLSSSDYPSPANTPSHP